MTRDQWRRLALLYAMFVALALSVAIFYVLARYRYPLVPLVMLFGTPARRFVSGKAGGARATARQWRRWRPVSCSRSSPP